MKVVIVGGAGAMGQAVVRTIAGFSEVTHILILDRDIARAEALAAEIGPVVRAQAFDADRDDLEPLLSDARAILSTLGPFTRFGEKILRAAVAAGCDYVDINDDWEPTLDVLSMSEDVASAGVTALIGMGASPGVSNVLAAKAVSELDSVNELITGWALAGTDSSPTGARPAAAMLHLVQQATGTIRVVEDGRVQDVPPLQSLTLQYPGIGLVEVRTVGHPEAVTLPRFVPGLTRCVNVMSGPLWWFDRLSAVMRKVDTGEISARDGALLTEEPVTRPDDAPPTIRMPAIWACATGTREGVATRVGIGLNRWPAGRMAGATAIPAAQALLMLLRGEITQPGVVTPEEVVPFDLLTERLAPYYTYPDETSELYSIVTERI